MADTIKKLSFTAEKIDKLLGVMDAAYGSTGGASIQVDAGHSDLEACVCDGETDDSDRLQAFVDYIASKGGGELKLPQGKTIMIKKEIELKDNVSIFGCGESSKIITDVGESENGLNMLKAFDKKNIRLSNFYIENTGYGLSGTWEPMGTFDGVGACMLFAGCSNVVVDNCHVVRGGGTIAGEGVSNIYFSCCYNSKAVNNHIEYGDNGLMVDTWYRYIDAAHAMFENDNIVFANNTIEQMTGRGICIENKTDESKAIMKGNVTVVGNTIRLCAYAGIQGNNFWNTVITGNTIHGDCTDIDGSTIIVFGGSTSATWYGIAIEDEAFQCIVSDNTIANTKVKGIYCKNAQNIVISNNNIVNMKPGSSILDKGEAICIENDEYPLTNVNVAGNNIYDALMGVRFILSVDARNSIVSNNTMTFTSTDATRGIELGALSYSSVNGNNISCVEQNASFIGIMSNEGKLNTVNDNNITQAGTGVKLIGDDGTVIDGNCISHCINGVGLDACTRTMINSNFKTCTNAFDMANGRTTQSTKCQSFNSLFNNVTNVKNGTGILLRYYASAAPSGTFEVGDRVINSTPASETPVEWVYYSGAWHDGFTLA